MDLDFITKQAMLLQGYSPSWNVPVSLLSESLAITKKYPEIAFIKEETPPKWLKEEEIVYRLYVRDCDPSTAPKNGKSAAKIEGASTMGRESLEVALKVLADNTAREIRVIKLKKHSERYVLLWAY